jgi:hypothetical protein
LRLHHRKIYRWKKNSNQRVSKKVSVSEIELYYSWIDQAPPAGFAYYRVKKNYQGGHSNYTVLLDQLLTKQAISKNFAQGEEENK